MERTNGTEEAMDVEWDKRGGPCNRSEQATLGALLAANLQKACFGSSYGNSDLELSADK